MICLWSTEFFLSVMYDPCYVISHIDQHFPNKIVSAIIFALTISILLYMYLTFMLSLRI